MRRMGCWRFFPSLVNFVSNDERIIGNVFNDLFLFFPFFFKFLSLIIWLFIHDSFKKFGILNLNVLKLFMPESLIETFIHSLFIRVHWVGSVRFLVFESGFFWHDGADFLEKHSVLSFNLSESILLKHFFFFALICSLKWEF